MNKNFWINATNSYSGKSPFQVMSAEEFTEFLYVMLRYKNFTLYLVLATNLYKRAFYLEKFLTLIEGNQPLEAVWLLEKKLLKSKPGSWSAETFAKFLKERKDAYADVDIVTQNTLLSEICEIYGLTSHKLYRMHAETADFKESLEVNVFKYDMSCIVRYKEIMSDWQEAIISSRSITHYISQQVLVKIIQMALHIQMMLLYKLCILKKIPNEKDEEIGEACYYVEQKINFRLPEQIDSLRHVSGTALDEKWFALQEQFYINVIAFNRHWSPKCISLAEIFWKKVLNISEKGGKVRDSLKIIALYWSLEQIENANQRYGIINTNENVINSISYNFKKVEFLIPELKK